MAAPEPTLRQRRVNELLQQQISAMLAETPPAELTGFVTIKAVQTTPDLREANVWFSVYGQDGEQVLKILKKNLYDIQGRLYRASSMRITPKIRFSLDHSEEFAEHISRVIKKIHDE